MRIVNDCYLESDFFGDVKPNNELKGYIHESKLTGAIGGDIDPLSIIDCRINQCDVIGCFEHGYPFGYEINWKGRLCETHRFIAQNILKDKRDIILYEKDKQSSRDLEDNTKIEIKKSEKGGLLQIV